MSHRLTNRALQTTPHEVVLHNFKEVTSERQVIPHDQAVTSMILMVQKWQEIHNLSLPCNEKIVDLCFGRHEVSLNSQLNHIDLCFNQYEVYC